jgi:hypothetical protein
MPPRATERDYWSCMPVVEDGILEHLHQFRVPLAHPPARQLGHAIEATIKTLAIKTGAAQRRHDVCGRGAHRLRRGSIEGLDMKAPQHT